LLLDGLDQAFLKFGIVHRQYGLSPVQINLNVRALAGFEDRSLVREPAPEFRARHSVIVNNIVYIGKRHDAVGLGIWSRANLCYAGRKLGILPLKRKLVLLPAHPFWFWLLAFAPLFALLIVWAAANTLTISFKRLLPWLWVAYSLFLVPYFVFSLATGHKTLRLALGAAGYSCWGIAVWIQRHYLFETLSPATGRWYFPWQAVSFSIPISTRILVSDIDFVSPWYIQKLGLRKASKQDLRDSDAVTLRFKADGRSVVLTTRVGLGAGNRLILFTKKIVKMRGIMAARGIGMGNMERDRQGTQYFQIHDPEGNEIEVVQEP
jgi:hypothetical protein